MAKKLTVEGIMRMSGLPRDEAEKFHQKYLAELAQPARSELKYFVFLTEEQLKAIKTLCASRGWTSVEFTRPDYTWSKTHRKGKTAPAPVAPKTGKVKTTK